MDSYEKWNENRTKIPAGRYRLRCTGAKQVNFWLEGRGGWGIGQKVLLIFQVIDGDYIDSVVPMFFPLPLNGKFGQGSKYYRCWCIANGLRKPIRTRLKEMPFSKFQNKVFTGDVVDVKPRWKNGVEEQPELFHYSRVDCLYELEVGDPNN